ncbi:MAG: hypothetical protein ACR2JE_08855 [Acidobacteriaceae bacterium]
MLRISMLRISMLRIFMPRVSPILRVLLALTTPALVGAGGLLKSGHPPVVAFALLFAADIAGK